MYCRAFIDLAAGRITAPLRSALVVRELGGGGGGACVERCVCSRDASWARQAPCLTRHTHLLEPCLTRHTHLLEPCLTRRALKQGAPKRLRVPYLASHAAGRVNRGLGLWRKQARIRSR